MKKILLLSTLMSLVMCGCSGKGYSNANIHAEIAPVKNDAKGIITIVSDDGFYETGVNLNELAGKNSIKVTVAGVVDIVSPYLDEWQNIEKQGNVEVISHSYSHKKMSEENNYSEEELRHQITDSIQYYKENFSTDQIAFICPENTMCSTGYDILNENNIIAIRQGNRGENELSPVAGISHSNWHMLNTFGIGDNETTEWRNALVDRASKNHTWIIEMWHNVYKEGEPIGYQGITYEDADLHMQYIDQKSKENEIWAASFVDATKYIYEKNHSSVQATINGNSIDVNLKMDESKLDPQIFDYPLTVKIPLPLGWDSKKVISSNETFRIQKNSLNGVEYILIDMEPNSFATINKK